MEDSMDIDIDLGDGIDYGTAAGEIMTMATPAASEAPQLIEDKDIPDAYKEDFDADFPAKDKIHITGLDGVAEPVILQFVEEHVPDKKVKRLQWIDDSSANIIFYKNEDAAEALGRLSVVQDTAPPPSQLRPAKTFNARPDLQFQIRQALVSDKKKPGAKDRSAFYLFNPEYDPENRRYDKRYDRRDNRRGRGGGGRYEDRYDRPDARRRKPVEKKTFTEDMYDDAPAGQTADEGELFRRMSVTSLSSGEHNRRRQSYEDIDLFDKPKRSDYGRLRDRSRSPVREDGDGRYGFSEQPARQRGRRRRSWTPPNERPPREARKDRKELFPDRAPPSAETPLSNGNRGLELFPNHSAKRSRELFPHKTQHSNHRRSDALDRAESVQILTPKRSLADRISGGPDGRGHSQPAEDTGFSVKGAGGFSVRGAARDINPKVKELFPDKVPSSGNMGKELFPGARGGPRRRAEDLFD
ncbi:Nuclear cap-binding protein subunit 3-like protein [Elsinoe fawcettii]|nr:Nuclear cap-binding protein subunit 3-like protein [Elsinoe fawcettii]